MYRRRRSWARRAGSKQPGRSWSLTPSAAIEPSFPIARVSGHSETEDPEHKRRKDVAGLRCRCRLPVLAVRRVLDGVEQVEQAHDRDQGGVLEKRDEVADDAWD